MKYFFLWCMALWWTVLSLPSRADALVELEQEWQQAMATVKESGDFQGFPHGRCFKLAAFNYSLPEALLLALARGESDFDPLAISKANAVGVMQIQWPGTARHLGFNRQTELFVPCNNIDAGSRYFKELLDRYQGKVHLALAAYNYGPGRIQVAASQIPDGALWYSRYILQHFHFVTGRGRFGKGAEDKPVNVNRPVVYQRQDKLALIRFNRPYRAEAYVKLLQDLLPDIQFSWFRQPDYRYLVVALDEGRGQAQLRQRLSSAGVLIE